MEEYEIPIDEEEINFDIRDLKYGCDIDTRKFLNLKKLTIYLNLTEIEYLEPINLDLSNNINLEELRIDSNQIRNIDLSKNINLKSLISNCILLNIDLLFISIKRCINLEYIDIQDNLNNNNKNFQNTIDYLDFSNNTKITFINLHGVGLKKINLLKNTKLIYLNLEYNNLHSIDLSDNILLEDLYLSCNNLKFLDLSKNINLKKLFISNNKLKTLNLNKNINLQLLSVSNNLLNFLDLNKNINLQSFDANNNLLNSLILNLYIDKIFIQLKNNNFLQQKIKKRRRIYLLCESKVGGIFNKNSLSETQKEKTQKEKTLIENSLNEHDKRRYIIKNKNIKYYPIDQNIICDTCKKYILKRNLINMKNILHKDMFHEYYYTILTCC